LVTAVGKVAVKGIAEIGAKEAVAFVGYHGLDEAGVVRYVGITSRDAAVRFAEHGAAEGTGRELLRYRVVQGAKFASKTEARIWEQQVLNRFGGPKGGQLLNRINSIARRNWLLYGIH
jgi:hypothetical protein